MAGQTPCESLFIGDLPETINDELLQTVFGAYGTVVSCRALPAKAPGMKGAGIVRFSTVDEAKWFQENVNGNVPQGLETPIVVKFKDQTYAGKGEAKGFAGAAAPQWQKGGWGGAAGAGGGAAAPAPAEPNTSVFIGDVPDGLDDAGVRAIFGKYGTVTSCKALPAKSSGQQGACLVTFATVEEATWLVENVNGNVPEGLESPVVIKFKSQGTKGGGDWGKGGGEWGKGGGSGFDAGPYGGAKGSAKGGSSSDIEQVVKGLGKTAKLPDENQVYVRGLPSNTTDLDLYKIFNAYGAIPTRGVKAMVDQEGACTGVGFVDFFDPACAQAAAQALNDTPLPDGTALSVMQKRAGGKGKGKEAAPAE